MVRLGLLEVRLPVLADHDRRGQEHRLQRNDQRQHRPPRPLAKPAAKATRLLKIQESVAAARRSALGENPSRAIVQSLADLGERRGIVIVSSSWLNLVERRCSRVTSAPRRQGKDASRAAILLQLLAQPPSPTASTSPVTARSWEGDVADRPLRLPGRYSLNPSRPGCGQQL